MKVITQIRLKASVIEAIRKNQSIRNRLQLELNRSYPTIQRWLDSNNEMLTTATSLRIISEETGISQENLLAEE